MSFSALFVAMETTRVAHAICTVEKRTESSVLRAGYDAFMIERIPSVTPSENLMLRNYLDNKIREMFLF